MHFIAPSCFIRKQAFYIDVFKITCILITVFFYLLWERGNKKYCIQLFSKLFWNVFVLSKHFQWRVSFYCVKSILSRIQDFVSSFSRVRISIRFTCHVNWASKIANCKKHYFQLWVFFFFFNMWTQIFISSGLK